MPTLSYRSFAAGEISPDMGGRAEQVKYQTGLSLCRNFVTRPEGSVENRAGFGYVSPLYSVENSATTARMLPFIYSDDQSYVLVLEGIGSGVKFYVIKDGAALFDDSNAITGITAANPAVMTAVAHGWTANDMIYVSGVVGMTQVNTRWFRISNTAANTLRLNQGSAIDSSGFTAYTSGGTAQHLYQVALPVAWSASMLSSLRYRQSGDVITLTHPDAPPLLITRIADTNWTAVAATFNPTVDQPNGGGITGTAGAAIVRYQVTTIDATTLEESFAGLQTAKACQVDLLGGSVPYRITTGAAHLWSTGQRVYFDATAPSEVSSNSYVITVTGATTFTLDGTNDLGVAVAYLGEEVFGKSIASNALTAATSANPVTVTWTAVANALEYNIYKELNGVFGYVGTAGGTSFIDLGYTVETTNTAPIEQTLFAVAGDYPTAVGYYQQRLLLGGPDNDPERIRASRSGLFYNFTRSNPIQSDDAISWIIASGQVNGIRHFLDMGRLMVFTAGAIFSIEGDDAGTLTPTAINPRLRAEQGVGDVEPLAVSDVVLFVQTSGRVVREIAPDPGEQRYQSNDLTVFARHLFKDYGITRWTYAEEPTPIVWAVRSDGSMLGCTYLRKHEILGWHRHDTGDGDTIFDLVTVPENNESAVYALIKRLSINGHTESRVERMATRAGITTADDGRFFDSWASYDGTNVDLGNNMTIAEDNTLVTFPYVTHTVSGSGITFTASMVGDAVVFTFPDGTTATCVITEVASSSLVAVDVTDLGNVPGSLPGTFTTWAYAPRSFGGLWHLEGRTVYAVGDNTAIGPFTVSSGTVSLGDPYARVTCGLRIEADGATLEPDNLQGETWSDKTNTVSAVTVRVKDTDGLEISADGSAFQGQETRFFQGNNKPAAGELVTGKLRYALSAKRGATGQVYFRQYDGLPSTILALYPNMTIGS